MRFLMVSLGYHPDVLGGAWRVAAAQAEGLVRRGHDVEVITAHPGGGAADAERRAGVRIARFPQRDAHFLVNWRAENRAAAALIRDRLRASDEGALIVQHHAYLEPAVATAPAPVLHVFHGPWAAEFGYARQAQPRGRLRRAFDGMVMAAMRRVEHRALRRANRILVLSRHSAEALARIHGPRVARPEIVPGGVDFDRFHPVADREAVRGAWGLDPEVFLLVATRRLDPRMGLDLLVEAVARVRPAFPRVRLWLTGKGPAEAGLRAQIGRLGLGETVRLLGVLPEDELPRLLNAADAALMPSVGLEGFGLATAEALACGTPVLGSRSGATPELIEPLADGLLFEPGSVEALAERLGWVLKDRTGLPSREACAAYARARFSWDHQVLACERIAGTLLGRSP